MNFEPKYLIRWGLLGWTYLAIIMAYFILRDYEAVRSYFFNKDASIMVSSITLFIVSGIIIGNLLHQFSLSFGYIIWINKKKSFKKDYEMDLKVIESQYGKEIQRIYSNRLGNVYALRALCLSIFLSLITLVILSLTITFSIKIGILILIVLFLNWIVLNNWVYFQNNLDYFIKNIKSEFE